MRYTLLLWLIVFFGRVFSQTPLQRISDLQIKEDSFYRKGTFPSEISWKKGKKVAEDNNIFFTALITFTLQSLYDSVDSESRGVVDSIQALSHPYQYYKNRNGDITYNFYQVRPETPFPTVPFMAKKKSAKLPDDLDDTSLMYLINNSSDSLKRLLKSKMVYQSDLHPRVATTIRPFRNTKAYRTWFADKMEQDLDICVVTNVLLFVISTGLPFEDADIESLDFIRYVINNDLHREKPHKIAANYPYTSVILYHVSRIISALNDGQLDDLGGKVKEDLLSQLNEANNEMEKVVLLTSLYRLGHEVEFKIDSAELKKDMESFYWFDAHPLSINKNLRKIMGKSNITRLKYRSEAYYWALVMELEVLSRGNN